MAVSVQHIRVNGRIYVDLVDLERFLRKVQEANPGMSVSGYVDHVVRQVCERE
jgi:hypothetical protein